eukprot:TRINITY_DN69097_c0_g1_i1.p1 TRINITY_DN69097_c0_g1~~TRINITY_DN69097_c0_g1_i1.p1  ORF type:complete len:129 (-),score=5.68 TRINITY_DN69097_c0_g1_i1:18-404(-)
MTIAQLATFTSKLPIFSWLACQTCRNNDTTDLDADKSTILEPPWGTSAEQHAQVSTISRTPGITFVGSCPGAMLHAIAADNVAGLRHQPHHGPCAIRRSDKTCPSTRTRIDFFIHCWIQQSKKSTESN